MENLPQMMHPQPLGFGQKPSEMHPFSSKTAIFA
jgi:hypothetical protein